jgi:hypothetical protein
MIDMGWSSRNMAPGRRYVKRLEGGGDAVA